MHTLFADNWKLIKFSLSLFHFSFHVILDLNDFLQHSNNEWWWYSFLYRLRRNVFALLFFILFHFGDESREMFFFLFLELQRMKCKNVKVIWGCYFYTPLFFFSLPCAVIWCSFLHLFKYIYGQICKSYSFTSFALNEMKFIFLMY